MWQSGMEGWAEGRQHRAVLGKALEASGRTHRFLARLEQGFRAHSCCFNNSLQEVGGFDGN